MQDQSGDNTSIKKHEISHKKPIVSPMKQEDDEDDSHLDIQDIAIRHEQFPVMVDLSAKIKALYQKTGPYESPPLVNRQTRPCNEVMNTVSRMQTRLLRNPHNKRVIPRGKHPIIDDIIKDCIETLTREYERGLQVLEMKNAAKEKREAIAIKYSKWQTDILMKWMIRHRSQPFPANDQIVELMQETHLTRSQIINWTTNVRKRSRKATCENGKKPHHFIDFLFLVQNREEQNTTKTPKKQSHSSPCATDGNFSEPLLQSAFPEDDDTLYEPIQPGQAMDDELLYEFAKVWLQDSGAPSILPAVTVDSEESRPLKRLRRVMSFELEDLEDIGDWAREMGLSMDV